VPIFKAVALPLIPRIDLFEVFGGVIKSVRQLVIEALVQLSMVSRKESASNFPACVQVCSIAAVVWVNFPAFVHVHAVALYMHNVVQLGRVPT
jgi:hypothetical protein